MRDNERLSQKSYMSENLVDSRITSFSLRSGRLVLELDNDKLFQVTGRRDRLVLQLFEREDVITDE